MTLLSEQRKDFFMENFTPVFTSILAQNKPAAVAWIKGNNDYPNLGGMVGFFEIPFRGILVNAEIFGLPDTEATGNSAFYGMHIHELGDCTPPFDKSGNHYNPTNQPHPYHAGDLPPLFGNHGFAWSAFFDYRFSIEDIIDRSIIIHKKRDDFTTQPSGDSGEKIGCGVIKLVH